MTAITDNRIANKLEAIIRHYFDSDVDPMFDDSNNLAYMGLIGFCVSLIVAFFTMGVSTAQGEYFVSQVSVVVGMFVFMALALLHGLMVVFGSFYKRGVFKTVGFALGITAFCIGYFLAFIFGTLGGFFIVLAIGVSTPSFGVLAPFKVILFAIPAIWWFVKGWSLVVEFNSLEETFEVERSWLNKHGIEI